MATLTQSPFSTKPVRKKGPADRGTVGLPSNTAKVNPGLGDHCWWRYVPTEKRRGLQLHSWRRRQRQRLIRRWNGVVAIAVIYLLLCLLLHAFGAGSLFFLAILPLLLLPKVSLLAWWLAWKEFHH